jgi:hypothetical protein
MKKKTEKKKKNQQPEVASPGGKSAIVNGSAERQNVAEEKLNTENEKSNEQTILESRTQKGISNDKVCYLYIEE